MKTKDKILRSALKLFVRQGIDNTSMSQIAKDAGVGASTLSSYFKSKPDLSNFLYVDIKKRIIAELTDMVDPNLSTERNIKNMVKWQVNYFLKNYSQLVFLDLRERGQKIPKRVIEIIESEYITIAECMKDWRAEGDLKNVDLALLSKLIWSNVVEIAGFLHRKKIASVGHRYLDVVWDVVRK